MTNLFTRLDAGRQQPNGKDPNPQGHDQTATIETDQARQERLEARLATLAADLRRFLR